jgi:hypothetical protein
MRPGDLTTLSSIKLWLKTTSYTSSGPGVDQVLAMLTTRWSQAILAYLERPWILPKSYINEAYDGHDNTAQFLKNWPVTSVSGLWINGQMIPPLPIVQSQIPGVTPPASFMYGFGYRFEQDNGIPPGGPQAIQLLGSKFYCGYQNIQVSYTAGYQVTGEAQEIPDPISPSPNPTLTVLQPYGIWGSDQGVTYADGLQVGVALTPVNTDPVSSGQYQIIQPDAPYQGEPAFPGIYKFAPADAGSNILISYGYIPSALEQIAMELVLERYRYRDRIGEMSHTLASQTTVKYDNSGFPAYSLDILQRFKSVLPL